MPGKTPVNDLLTDWYFTRCVNLLKEQSSALLVDLQVLHLDTLEPTRHVSAVRRVVAADHRIRIFSIPALLDLVMRDVSVEATVDAAEAVMTIAADGVERTVEVAIVDLVDMVRSVASGHDLDGREVHDVIARLDVIATAAAGRALVDEHTPYFGLTSQHLHVVLLALASRLARSPGVAAALSQRLASVVSDQPEGVLAEVISAAATGNAGRMPLRLAVELVASAVDPEAGRGLLVSSLRTSDRVSSFEPDLLQTAAALQPESDSLLDEVLYLRGLTAFLAGEPSDTRPSTAVLRRLGIHGADAVVLRALIWQVATVGRVIAQPHRYADDIEALLATRRSPRPMRVAPPRKDDKDWAPLASALASVSGGNWQIAATAPRQKPVSTRAAANAVGSPWLTAHGKDTLVYPALSKLSGVLRLSLSSLAAARELSRPGILGDEQDATTRSNLAGLVLVADAMLEADAWRVWNPLVVAARRVMEELTVGHVGSVAPESLYAWIEDVDDKLQAGRPGPIGVSLGEQVVARPLAWAHAILPHLDQAGPSRWGPEMVEMVEFELDVETGSRVDVLALVLNDILRRFHRPFSQRHMPAQPTWQELRRQPTVDHHAILLSPTTSFDDWSLRRRAKLTAAATAALAIRQLEAADTSDQGMTSRIFAELTDAMAVIMRQRGRDHFHVLVRAVALLEHSAVRESTARVEQVAGLGIVSHEPTIWRYVFDRALQHDAPLGDEEGTINRLLAGALRRLLTMEQGDETTQRLRSIWRQALEQALQDASEDERRHVRRLLVDAADLDGARAADLGAVPRPLTHAGPQRQWIRPAEGGVAGAAWLTQGLVIDPIDDEHVAFVDTRDTLGISAQFPPHRRPRHSLGTVVSVSENDGVRSATLNVGGPDLWSVSLRGRVPAHETLPVGEPVIAVLDDHGQRKFRLLDSKLEMGRPTATRLEHYRESPELRGRSLQLRVKGRGAEAVDHRRWDADTSRAFSDQDERTADVIAVFDAPQVEWLPFVRDGLALVVEMAATGAPTTLVLNTESDDGWIFSASPGKAYKLRRSDLSAETVVTLVDLLSAHDDPNGLLVTFALGTGLTLELWSGEHRTEIHGAIVCPVDDRNLRWRAVIDDRMDGVLLSPKEGVWNLPVQAPARPFPSAISLTVERSSVGRRPPRDEPQFIAPDEFDPKAQRTGRLRARVEPAYSLGDDTKAVFSDFFAGEDATVELARVIRQTVDGRVMCATTHGIVVMIGSESMSLVPLTPDTMRTLDVRGRSARLAPLRPLRHEVWTMVAETTAVLLRPILEGAAGSVVGLVWSVRRGAQNGVPVPVRFYVDGHPEVAIDFGTTKVHVGSVVSVRLGTHPGMVEISVARTFRVGDLLFRELVQGQPTEGCVYVGQTSSSGGAVTGVLQTPEGSVLTSDVPSDLPLFSVHAGGRWNQPRRPWESSCQVERGAEGGRTQWVRVAGDGGTIGGSVTRAVAVGAASVQRSRIVVRRRMGQVVFSRELDIVNVRRQRTTGSSQRRLREQVGSDPGVDIVAELHRMASRGTSVEVEVDPQDLSQAYVTELLQLGCQRREAALPVVDADPVLVSSAGYDSLGTARLVATGANSFGLSFREVPDLDLTALAALLGATYDEEVRPGRLLYAMQRDGRHVFEVGFGLRASATNDELRFDDRPFDDVKGVLFHGDQIGSVVFTSSDGDTVMVVREASITASAGTTLYRQAADHKFLHLLRVERESGALRVRQIEGFSTRATVNESRSFFGPHVARAVLETDADELDVEVGSSRLIYGELDTQRFLDSAGIRLVFHHRTLTQEGLAQIGHGVVTFVTGGRIHDMGNEVGLAVGSASDRSQDLDASVRVIRRNFSVDVNQLVRLKNLEGERALAGSLLVAWVRKEARQRSGVEVRLGASAIPTRSTESLRDLARDQDGVFLLVDELTAGRAQTTIRLEYRHGIYFRLRSDEIESTTDDLVRQDVVRLTVSPDTAMFTISRCSPSDRRFFDAAPRPMVALPANRLLTRNAPADSRTDGYWTRGDNGAAFIAGGLPGEMAGTASYTSAGGWGRANPRELTALMGEPHPKIALFGLRQGKLSAAPAGAAVGAGAISFASDSRVTATVNGTENAVDPAVLTFADIAALELRKRARAVSWHFHDTGTGSWETDDTVRRQPLGAHSVVSGGPVFFEAGVRLRYTTALDQWAYSSAFLSHGVRSKASSIATAVAGISRAGDGQPDGLYLEVTPGVICLVLGTLLGIRLSGGVVVPLDEVSMGSFGVGDRLDVVVRREADRSVDTVLVVRWTPSGRGLAGTDTQRMVLPVQHFDDKTGRLLLGAGRVQLHVPTWKAPSADAVVLTAANEIAVPDGALDRGDTVLLIVDDNKLAVAGLPGVKPSTRENTWAEDRWHRHLFKDGQFIAPRLKNEVLGAGGAMAVTVEHHDTERGALLFSFRQQFEPLIGGQPMLGHVVGSEGRFLLVRLASAIVRIRADRVVSGLPNDSLSVVAAVLEGTRTPVWLSHDGADFAGPLPAGGRFTAEADVDVAGVVGIVARDAKTNGLAWIPGTMLALTTLDRADRRALWFGADASPFSAALVVIRRESSDAQTPVASMLDVPAVINERSRLRRGLELGVTVRHVVGVDAGRRIIAATLAGTLIELRCLEPDTIEVGEQLNVEVQSIESSGASVIAVPVGERRLELVLPKRLLAHIPPVGEHRHEFNRLLELLDTPPPDDLTTLADAEVLERLAQSHTAVAAGRVSAAAASYAVDWWRGTRAEDEVDLLPALLAVHLLLSASTAPTAALLADSGTDDEDVLGSSQQRWEFAASEVLASVGRRALRSLHVEALMRYWLEQRHAHEGFAWRQWEMIVRAAGEPLMPNTEATIEPMLRQLEFGAGSEGRRVAAAIRLACGSREGAELLIADRDLLLPELVRHVRVADPALKVFRGRRAKGVVEAQLSYVVRTIARMRSNGNDVILLPEPTWFE